MSAGGVEGAGSWVCPVGSAQERQQAAKVAAPGSPDPRVPELEQGFYKTPNERSLSAGNGPAEASQDVTRAVSCHTVNEQWCR